MLGIIASGRRASLDDSLTVPEGWGSVWYPARDGGGLATIVSCGDSWPQGYYSGPNLHDDSFTGQLADLLQSEFGDGGSGFHSIRNTTGIGATGATYITRAGAWAAVANTTINETSNIVSALGTGRSFTTPGVRGQFVDLWWLRNISLSTGFDYNIDGGAATGNVLDAGGGTGVISQAINVGAGTHSVVQSSRADRWMIATGVAGRNASGVIVHNMGMAGRTSAFGTSTTSLSGGKNSGDVTITDWSPHLLILCLGVNDIAAGLSKATHKANMERIIADGNGCDVMMVIQHRGNIADAGNLFTQYEDAAYEIQAANDKVAIYNCWADFDKSYNDALDVQFWGTTNSATGVPDNDPGHPGNAGHAHIADRLNSVLALAA